MPTLDIDKLFSDLRPELDELESARLVAEERVQKLNRYVLGGGAVAAVLAWQLLNGWAALVAGLLAFVYYAYAQHQARSPVQAGYKTRVLPEIITRLGEDFSYVQGGDVPVARLEQSGLFGKFNVSVLDDHIGLRRRQSRWDLYDVHLQLQTQRDHDNSSAEISVFKGLVFSARVETPFRAKAWIITRGLNRLFCDEAVIEDRPTVRTGDEGFDQRYQVFMDEPDQVALALGPELRARMMSLRDRLGLEEHVVNFALIGQELTVSVQHPDAFENRVDQSLNDPDQFRRNVEFLVACTRMLDHLGLEG